MTSDLSVVIPTYRRPTPLREALCSVLRQRDVTLDVLVVDDCPHGSAQSIVNAINDPRVRYMRRSTSSGGNPGLVRNDGWPEVTGRYIHFLDDDDRVADHAYRDLVDTLDRRTDCGVAFGVVAPFGDSPSDLRRELDYFRNAARRARLVSRLSTRRLIALNMLFKSTLLINSACIIRRESVGELGGYDPRAKMDEDVEFYVRAIRKYGAVFLDRVVVHYRTGAPSLMHDRPDDSEIHRTYGMMYEKYRDAYGAAELFALKLVARTVLRWP